MLDLSFNPNMQFSPPLLFLPTPSFSLLCRSFQHNLGFGHFPALCDVQRPSHYSTRVIHLYPSVLSLTVLLFIFPFLILLTIVKNKRRLMMALILSLFFFANDGFYLFTRSYLRLINSVSQSVSLLFIFPIFPYFCTFPPFVICSSSPMISRRVASIFYPRVLLIFRWRKTL